MTCFRGKSDEKPGGLSCFFDFLKVLHLKIFGRPRCPILEQRVLNLIVFQRASGNFLS